jgi:superfamily II RNA helicase
VVPESALRLDPFQQQALAAINRGSSVLLAAPTGAGKTVVAEMAIDRALAAGKRALYASPLKALSNQKHRDFAVRVGPGQAGLLTGDTQVNPGARVVVLTTEILHNRLITGELGSLRDVGCIVFDEFHYLSDADRGATWEQSIMLCPRHVQIACLSATLPNIEELAGWMRQHVDTLEVVVETARPVPLSFHYFAQGELQPALGVDGLPDRGLKRFDSRPGRGEAPALGELLPLLTRERMVPALCFVFSRREAERLAALAAGWLGEHLPQTKEAAGEVEREIAALAAGRAPAPQASALLACLRAGAGFHHAGLLPQLKELVERLFGRGLLPVLCATETFALGINMPARTVVLPRLTKFDGKGHRDLSAREFQQMIGRAGRRGLDDRGHVVLVADPRKPFGDVARLVSSELEPVESAFAFSYNTLLNVSAAYGDSAADELLARSFQVHQIERQLKDAEERLADLQRASEGRQPANRSQVAKAGREVQALRTALEVGRHRTELAAMRSALAELGYEASSPKACLVKGVFARQSLLLAELLDDPRLDLPALSGPELAELASWFIDSPRPGGPRPSGGQLPPRLRRLAQLLEDATARVQGAERRGGTMLTRRPARTLPLLVYRSCEGAPVPPLCRDYRVSEGELAARLDETRRLLRQLLRASQAIPAYAELARAAAAAVQCLRRDGGDAEAEADR